MSDRTITTPAAVSFDAATPAVVIDHLTVTDSEVVAQARRWAAGTRSAAVGADGAARDDGADGMGSTDLAPFVTQALGIGARAIASAGAAQDTFELERLVSEVGTRTVESSELAAKATATAATVAADAMGKAADAARKAILDTEAAGRKGFAATVELSTKALRDDIERLIGGEHPELLARLGPVLDAAGRAMGERAFEQTDKLLDKVSRQFDPADPTSPFAKQAAALAEQQQALTASMDKNHAALVGKVEQLAKAVEVQQAARQAAARTASVTPLKGGGFEAAVGAVMERIAAGLGDEYVATGGFAGTIRSCKKGDGVLTVGGGPARVVIEMHDSSDSRDWNDYLEAAERNREATASVGVVRNVAQNKGQTIRVLGPRRVVVAFDPGVDEPDLLRTVVQLMRTSAVVASSRRDVEGLETAEESITAAMGLMERINAIRKASGSVRRGADTIDRECNTVQSGVERHLGKALDALRGVALEAADLVSDASDEDGTGTGAA
ncbi:Fis family transcriptional regulator [Intrasporangium sp.]|uniref:Fis family transcriptional regulator n=1 Tax=Intrasporangium sp. TaxID=1925024 RepID=UPI0032220A4C